jgi:hypothetical protein
MRRMTFAITLLLLAACSPRGRWVDAWGEGRGLDEMKKDSVDCYGTVNDGESLSGKKLSSQEFDKRLDLCMADRGWKVRE